MAEQVPIPEVPGLPWLGNVTTLDPESPLLSMCTLADKYGEIYRLRFGSKSSVFVSTRALVHELCDEKRFKKNLNVALRGLRAGLHDGLFTAKDEEENWGIAHRILMPAFGPLSIRNMFDEMHDIASQLALKWARNGPDAQIHVTDDFTRLTLDTLALCSMGYRFNSYYSPEMHPFISAMVDFLVESGTRERRLPLPGVFYRARDEKYEADIEILRKTARGVLESRRRGSDDRKDLLTAMLKGVDPKTSKKMTDDSIMDNLITFLIAGHETTSGLLSFAFYQLMQNPEAYQKAQAEVDQVIGKGPITPDHMSKLPYLNAVLRETLRINSTIPTFTVEPREDTVIGGKYAVNKGETMVLILPKAHLDPETYGDDVLEFKPERMLDEPFEKLNREFPDAWKPFGNGMRACIGRPFAWQEALLVTAMLLQNFNFVLDPGYIFGVKQTLTIKPADLYMRAILRDGMDPTSLQHRLTGATGHHQARGKTVSGEAAEASTNGIPLTVLYGSNSGTCEALAQRVATDAPQHGFRACKVDCLDSAKGSLPQDQPVVIITASYEGQPPDNAGHFMAWLQNAKQDELKNVSYAVFGCGHKDWVQTYHRVPKLVDSLMGECGAKRMADIGLADASSGDIFTAFETWEDTVLWPSLSEEFDVSEQNKEEKGIDVVVSTPRSTTLRQNVKEATVVQAHDLCPSGEKKHLELKLPDNMSYSAGDYLAVLPINPAENVHRVMRRFKLARDAYLEIKAAGGLAALPTNTSVPANDVLSSYVELSQPATKKNLTTLAQFAVQDKLKSTLKALAEDKYNDEIRDKRISVLDVLEAHPDLEVPIGVFLSMIPPMRVRQYSISSSPLADPTRVTITFSVLNQPHVSGHGSYVGVATSYLSSLKEDDTVHVAIRPSQPAFSAPTNVQTTPAIYIAAGSGIAPFRGFIQERAEMLSSQRRDLAPAMLFFGCRAPDQDDLYRDELDQWEKLGAVEVHRAFSKSPEQSEDCRHVDDAMWKHRKRLLQLWVQGAKVYVCGSRAVAEAVKAAIIKIKVDYEGDKADEHGITEWFEGLRNIRYVTDVFD